MLLNYVANLLLLLLFKFALWITVQVRHPKAADNRPPRDAPHSPPHREASAHPHHLPRRLSLARPNAPGNSVNKIHLRRVRPPFLFALQYIFAIVETVRDLPRPPATAALPLEGLIYTRRVPEDAKMEGGGKGKETAEERGCTRTSPPPPERLDPPDRGDGAAPGDRCPCLKGGESRKLRLRPPFSFPAPPCPYPGAAATRSPMGRRYAPVKSREPRERQEKALTRCWWPR
mmetsp:Transcript_6161/g.14927  ORF Transcript_6161/g.14927 Transcript_6161/m.14927 type:complete len:231 (-) Transcript_6161:2207-2899(-)